LLDDKHLCLAQAVYCADNDARVGNGAITKALIELEKYHDALDGDFYSELLYNDDAERPRTHHTVNHRVRRITVQGCLSLLAALLDRQTITTLPSNAHDKAEHACLWSTARQRSTQLLGTVYKARAVR
jgi:hypothetical protein